MALLLFDLFKGCLRGMMIGDRLAVVSFDDDDAEGESLWLVGLIELLVGGSGGIIGAGHVKVGVVVLRTIDNHIPKGRNSEVQLSSHIESNVIEIIREHSSSLVYDESDCCELFVS